MTFPRNSRFVLALGTLALSGCTLWMRDATFYADELSERLEQRSESIAGCYDRLLERDPSAKGEVVVDFEVAKQTGEFVDVTVDTAKSTAPEPLASCVTEELSSMRMEPVDAKTAHATFTWNFTPAGRKRNGPDPFGSAQTTLMACYASHLSEVDREASGELVIDYAFDRGSGAMARVEVVADQTTAPAAVVQCAMPAFEGAKVDPKAIEARDVEGRRGFVLRLEVAGSEPTAEAEPQAEVEVTSEMGMVGEGRTVVVHGLHPDSVSIRVTNDAGGTDSDTVGHVPRTLDWW